MPATVQETSHEHVAGMELFATDTPPLGGKLRLFAEDFVVDEIGGGPRPNPEGKHVAARIRLTNWEQNHFVRDASRKIGIGRNQVGFAGTKDKRAVTTQWFSFLTRLDEAEVKQRIDSMNRAECLETYRSEKSVRLGMHDGNGFTITVRGIQHPFEDVRAALDGTVDQLNAMGGVPNYFGIQRFGIIRPITQIVGRHIVHGDLEGAVMTYLTAWPEGHNDDMGGARLRLAEDRDWKRAVDDFPKELRFERAILQQLSAEPDDWKAALRQLPRNLVILFVHAYQSWLYNRMLSERMRRGLPLDEPLEGDIVLPLTRGAVPNDVQTVLTTSSNIDKVREQVRKGRALVGGLLVGQDSEMAQGEPGEIERAILESDGIEPAHFRNHVLPEATSSGTRRPYLVPVRDLAVEVHPADAAPMPVASEAGQGAMDHNVMPTIPDGCTAVLKFSLPRGAYATCLLREIMKADDTTVY